MNVRLWDSPYNGGWIWFDRRNLWRVKVGWDRPKFWWAVLGFSGLLYLQSWPWQSRP